MFFDLARTCQALGVIALLSLVAPGRDVFSSRTRSAFADSLQFWPARQVSHSEPAIALRRDSCRVPWTALGYDRSALKQAWQSAGRPWLKQYSGLEWHSNIRSWFAEAKAPGDRTQDAYYLAQALDPAVFAAATLKDIEWLDELSLFYSAAVGFFASAGPRPTLSEAEREQGGARRSAAVRILSSDGAGRPECVLCSAQFLFPASHLIRAIAELPAEARTPAMLRFMADYAPLITDEQLVRWIRTANRNYWKAKDLDSSYLATWKQLSIKRDGEGPRYAYAVVDTDLWITAIAAELLAAHARAPDVLTLSSADIALLSKARGIGVRLLASRAIIHPDTRDWAGRVVGSLGFFEGDFGGYPDVRYAADTSASRPSGAPSPAAHVSWDVSHITRLPVVLRSLNETRLPSDAAFPTATDLRLTVNQFLYRVFTGDLQRPRLRNYFDGTDGWYRVGYHGVDFGYAPSRFCDNRGSHPCLQSSGYSGWSRLIPFNGAMCDVAQAVASLASSSDSASREFADRTFREGRMQFALDTLRQSYPFRLFVLLADNADVLR